MVHAAGQHLDFFSRKLCDNVIKYSTFNNELSALFLATRHFRFLLESHEFTAVVVHKPTMFAMAKTTEPWPAWQQCHLSSISEFTTDIQHVTGKSNLVADCFFQAHVSYVHLGLNYTAVATDLLVESRSSRQP